VCGDYDNLLSGTVSKYSKVVTESTAFCYKIIYL
jgi:hypothetical protein